MININHSTMINNILEIRISILLILLFHPFIINFVVSECPQKPFNCGILGNLQFPFSNYTQPECGLFSVNCDVSPPKVQFWPGGIWYDVHDKLSTDKFRVLDTRLHFDLIDKSCSFLENRFSVPKSPFLSFTISPTLTMFSCSKSLDPDVQVNFISYRNYTGCNFSLYYKNQGDDFLSGNTSNIPENCSAVQMPVKLDNQDSDDLFQMLTADFNIEWNVSADCLYCHLRGGNCVSDDNGLLCKESSTSNKALLIGGVAVTVLTPSLLFLFFSRRKLTLLKLLGLQTEMPDNEKNIEFFLKNNGNLALIRYKYSDLKKMSRSFNENLGKGGYGSVYKGKLRDGRLVAVKILNHESKGNGEEFINEVASISRTSHINIVTLIGFCFDGSKRALVYDFMPNGSLDKFIQNTGSSQVGLGWQKLFEISIGVARGLEYLHRLCNMRIVHFDIKPHNILLDKDFHPKISDFGLAKLCPNRSSIVSMLVARGTIGYIAPEVFNRNFGEVSHKSDVYSYGMMILEIAGGKKNIDPRDVDRSSEIYFPQYIYKQLEAENLDGIVDIEEEESKFVKRKLMIVGLWCIQTVPKDRPSMSKVVEMLEGKIEVVQVPPKPYLSSPPRPVLPKFSISESV